MEGKTMRARALALALTVVVAGTACQSEGDRILQASACQTLDEVGAVARYHADGGLEERSGDMHNQIYWLQVHQISPEVLTSPHGDTLRGYRDTVLLSLASHNVASATGDAGPDWDALVAQGVEAWDEFGCDRQLLTPAVWMPECDELESLQYRVRATCLSLQEREELRREAEDWIEDWIEQRQSPTTTED